MYPMCRCEQAAAICLLIITVGGRHFGGSPIGMLTIVIQSKPRDPLETLLLGEKPASLPCAENCTRNGS